MLVLFRLTVFAISQQPEKVIYNRKQYKLTSFPLESYFDKNPEKRPIREVVSNDLDRGYIATFEIIDRELYLTNIETQFQDTMSKDKIEIKLKSVMNDLFPNLQKVKITWYKGLLVLTHGNLVYYSNTAMYENYIILEIDNGDLMKSKEFDYKEYVKFEDQQYQEFIKTDEYKKIKADKEKGGPAPFFDIFIRNKVMFYTTKILVE
jgi:hypothetical protein